MTTHNLFPVELHATWLATDSSNVRDPIRDWLLDPTSLTARLKKHCQHFEVKVLGQQVITCGAKEANDDIKINEQVLVREVILYCDDQPQVFARSLLPLSSLTGQQQQLANIGNKSLGQLLFNQADLSRKKFEIARFDHNSSVAKLAKKLQLPEQDILWGRRSVFIIENKPLMVAEVFLPNAFAYDYL